MNTPVKFLEGAEIYLRPRQLDDADWLYHSLNNDVEGRRLGGSPTASSREQIVGNIQRLAGDPSRISFSVVRQGDNALVGGVVLDQTDGRLRSADFHIFIDAAYTGRGYGTEATRLMLDYGFGILNLHRIELLVFRFNTRAIHVYEKLGFVQEGTKRQSWYYDHAWHDTILMSMLEDEYRVRYDSQS